MKQREIEDFFKNAKTWKVEFDLLREIILQNNELEECYKWMHPCYTYHQKNVVLIHGFKEYCALLFHKGVLLNDPENRLIQQTENVQSALQLRFKNVQEIENQQSIIQDFLQQAILLEKSGAKVPLKSTAQFAMPEEFSKALSENPALQKAFEQLTPGRQRAYLLYFSQAKQSKTREARIEKYYDKILSGKGLLDD